jgi:putative ABC transport system permease protein
MNVISLSPGDLMAAACLVLFVAVLSRRMQIGIEGQILVAALRTAAQLFLIGFVLKALFANATLGWVTLMAVVMLLAAGREVRARQTHGFKGWWGLGLGTASMFASSFSVAILASAVIIGPDPWYSPQYAIPLLGMLLGNTMTGIAVGMDRLTTLAHQARDRIEQRLMLGQPRADAVADIYRESVRAGLIPIINAMAAAGLVSLPGMMTGQILAGSSPLDATQYQILIMFLIAGGTGMGTLLAVVLGARRLFDERERLRLDRLVS